jgi:hypothetical protein
LRATLNPDFPYQKGRNESLNCLSMQCDADNGNS